MAHLLFCLEPAGGANSPSRTSQGLNSRSQYFEIPHQPSFLTCPRSAPSNQPPVQQLGMGELPEKKLCLVLLVIPDSLFIKIGLYLLEKDWPYESPVTEHYQDATVLGFDECYKVVLTNTYTNPAT